MSKNSDLIQPDRGQKATSIQLVTKDGFEKWLKGLSVGQRAAVEAQKFEGNEGQTAIVHDGDDWFAAGGVGEPDDLSSYCLAALADKLPEGTYRLQGHQPGAAMHGWQTAQYRFNRYREDENASGPRVLLTKDVKQIDEAVALAAAENLVRDLVNTPAEDMGPAALESECERLAKTHNAKLKVTKGDTLEQDYPMVHAVGRAASRDQSLPYQQWEHIGFRVAADLPE